MPDSEPGQLLRRIMQLRACARAGQHLGTLSIPGGRWVRAGSRVAWHFKASEIGVSPALDASLRGAP
jgi:hypothetical protein